MNDTQLKETLGLFLITAKFKKLAGEKGIANANNKENTKSNGESVKIKVQERVPPTMLRAYNEAIACETVKDINKKSKSSSVVRSFGGAVSLNCLNRHRMVKSFESKSDAEKRTLKNTEAIKEGRKRQHNPLGNLDKYKWQSKECLDFVNNLEEGAYLNYSELARMFGLKDKDEFGKDNKNQIVKQFLINNGVEVDKFDYHKKTDNINVRRKKLKLSDNSRVSIPTEPTIHAVKKDLNLQILEGKYEMGELIVPIKFKKCSVSNGEIKWEEFEVRGRKTPLSVIRRNLYETHKSLYRTQSDSEIENMLDVEIVDYLKFINEYKSTDETNLKDKIKHSQRRRHLAIWHDGSTICNNSHVLFTCTELYDKAIHLTDEEAVKVFGKKIDVQETIETPEIYMFARNTELTV